MARTGHCVTQGTPGVIDGSQQGDLSVRDSSVKGENLNRRFRRVAVLAAVTTIAGLCAVGAPTAQAQTANPFTRPDKFCVKHTPPPGARNSSSPGITPNTIVLGEGSTDSKALARVGAQVIPTDDIMDALTAEINEVCGGINGRKIVMKHINNNPLNPDPVSMLTANCLKATEDFKVFGMIANTNLAPFVRCATVAHRTLVILAVPGAYDSSDLTAAKGRIFGNYPPNDVLAQTFVDYSMKRSVFKNKKAMVFGIQRGGATTAQDLDRDYVKPLKAKGVDIYAEVIPCIGTSNCRVQVGAMVTRAKDRGVDVFVIGQPMSNSTVGTMWKYLHEANYKPQIVGMTDLTIHSDPQQAGMISDAGAAAARFVSDLAPTSYTTDEQTVVGAWRVGYKQSKQADACLEVVNRRLKNNPPWSYTERFLTGSNYTGTFSYCKQYRALAASLWSLGNNVTLERASAALAKQAGDNLYVGLPEFRKPAFYSLNDKKPTKIATMRSWYPCPITSSTTPSSCNLPVDRPMRARPL
jgi:hypothetical protein